MEATDIVFCFNKFVEDQASALSYRALLEGEGESNRNIVLDLTSCQLPWQQIVGICSLVNGRPHLRVEEDVFVRMMGVASVTFATAAGSPLSIPSEPETPPSNGRPSTSSGRTRASIDSEQSDDWRNTQGQLPAKKPAKKLRGKKGKEIVFEDKRASVDSNLSMDWDSSQTKGPPPAQGRSSISEPMAGIAEEKKEDGKPRRSNRGRGGNSKKRAASP